MSGSKNYFEEFSQTWPTEVLAKPVMGERGQKNLPSGTEGGENLDLERHYEHKQHTFDHFCKTAIKHEAYNAFRQIRNQQNRFVSLSELPEEACEQLASYDTYPWEYTAFPVKDEVILIKDDALADALTALPQDYRDILLMHWFLQMADREIGEKLDMPRRTVNHRRQRAYELLKKLMGGDADA